jgi:acetylornithine/N-succinyldiaminopimelate aminotransferase
VSVSEIDKQYVANTYSLFNIEIERGKGSLLYDCNGKEYIDLGSGIAVNTFGVADDEWKAAVTAQLSVLQHTSNLYYTKPCADLAKLLCEKTGMKKVFFSNSGAEANECAIKTARKYSADKYGESKKKIITLKNSFHGRTVTTLSATGQDGFHTHFGPFTEGFSFCEANNIDELKAMADDGICAIMIELIQGEGGVLRLSEDFVREAAKITGEKDALLIIDEVQTGNGRTGELYAFMHHGIKPDIVSTAKGLAGGLPFGATLIGEKAGNTLVPGSHGSTFGGNPVCAAGALNILSRIDDKLLSQVKEKGDYIKNELTGAKGVKSVSGMGLMLGIETEKDAKEIVEKCIANGVIALTAKNKVRLLPALNIPFDVLRRGVKILKEVISQ